MELTPKATKDLKKILKKEIGEDGLAKFDDEMLDDLGMTLLNITTMALKRRIRIKKQISVMDKKL